MKKAVQKSTPSSSDVSSPPVVRVSGLGFSYKTRSALSNLSFDIREGELFGILGPNGSGKSTLFRVLSTLATPGTGDAEVAGYSVTRDPAEVRKRIGVVFQSAGLDVKLTVLENLMAQGALYRIPGDLLAKRISLSLQQFRVDDRQDDLVETLSGGLQRRVELAKGMLHAPQVLLLDEPTTGLDPRARLEFWRFLGQARKGSPLTIILTTHLTQEAEQCDRLAILDHGSLVALGSPQSLLEGIGGEIVALTGEKLDSLQKSIQRKFRVPVARVDSELRMELRNGAAFIPRLSRAFGDRIESITLRKPTLDDVFLHETGHGMRSDDPKGGSQ